VDKKNRVGILAIAVLALQSSSWAIGGDSSNARVTEIEKYGKALQYWLNLKDGCSSVVDMDDMAIQCEHDANAASRENAALTAATATRLSSAVTQASSVLGSSFFSPVDPGEIQGLVNGYVQAVHGAMDGFSNTHTRTYADIQTYKGKLQTATQTVDSYIALLTTLYNKSLSCPPAGVAACQRIQQLGDVITSLTTLKGTLRDAKKSANCRQAGYEIQLWSCKVRRLDTHMEQLSHDDNPYDDEVSSYDADVRAINQSSCTSLDRTTGRLGVDISGSVTALSMINGLTPVERGVLAVIADEQSRISRNRSRFTGVMNRGLGSLLTADMLHECPGVPVSPSPSPAPHPAPH
jgi:hypothetical protein